MIEQDNARVELNSFTMFVFVGAVFSLVVYGGF
jgi:hypothetical protein